MTFLKHQVLHWLVARACSIAAGLPAFHKSGAKPALKPGGLAAKGVVRRGATYPPPLG